MSAALELTDREVLLATHARVDALAEQVADIAAQVDQLGEVVRAVGEVIAPFRKMAASGASPAAMIAALMRGGA